MSKVVGVALVLVWRECFCVVNVLLPLFMRALLYSLSRLLAWMSHTKGLVISLLDRTTDQHEDYSRCHTSPLSHCHRSSTIPACSLLSALSC